MADSIELYFWPTPNGYKISIALEEMNLPYEVKLINIGAGDQFAPDFLKIAPNNRMPAIIDPDGPGGEPVSIFESGAILQYLARKTGKFGGTDIDQFHLVRKVHLFQGD
ncbi:MAG: glutathione S-transferase N-terminal domain-containing protein, partial [Pseudomonadota bacterium]